MRTQAVHGEQVDFSLEIILEKIGKMDEVSVVLLILLELHQKIDIARIRLAVPYERSEKAYPLDPVRDDDFPVCPQKVENVGLSMWFHGNSSIAHFSDWDVAGSPDSGGCTPCTGRPATLMPQCMVLKRQLNALQAPWDSSARCCDSLWYLSPFILPIQ